MFDTLTDLEAAIDKVAAGEGVVDVERISVLAARLEFQRLRAVGTFDRSCAWEHGGPTNLGNLKLLCWYHHRRQHIHDAQARPG